MTELFLAMLFIGIGLLVAWGWRAFVSDSESDPAGTTSDDQPAPVRFWRLGLMFIAVAVSGLVVGRSFGERGVENLMGVAAVGIGVWTLLTPARSAREGLAFHTWVSRRMPWLYWGSPGRAATSPAFWRISIPVIGLLMIAIGVAMLMGFGR